MLLLVVGAVVLVGEVWVRPTVEGEIAKGLERELQLTTRPEVEVRGFPFVLRALQERIDGVDVTVDGEVFRGLRVQHVELHVDNVGFSTSELLRGSGSVRISGGDGRARITDADLTAYLATTSVPLVVRFENGAVHASGSATVAGARVSASVAGQLSLAGDVLRFMPTSVDVGSLPGAVDAATVESAIRREFAFDAPVPELRGVRLTGVRVGDGVAEIGAAFESLDVDY
jgi:hypothetical protein